MSDNDERTDWSEVEGRLVPSESQELDYPQTPSMEPSPELSKHPIIERFGGPKGMMMQYQAGKVQRKQALEGLKAWYGGQLAVAKTQIDQAVRVQTAQARVDATKFLHGIDQEYLHYLGELGLQNVDKRQQMLIRLSDQTAKNLKQVIEADWPKPMKDDAVNKMREMHEKFAEKLAAELSESSHHDGD